MTQRLRSRLWQELFTTDITLPVLDLPELYGGKLVAAMDRQHPRDMFDVSHMLEHFGWRSSYVDCFVAYLACHNRPVHEVLFPNRLPLEPAFSSEFTGLTVNETAMETLEQTQSRLIDELPRALTSRHREFLLSLVSAEPVWMSRSSLSDGGLSTLFDGVPVPVPMRCRGRGNGNEEDRTAAGELEGGLSSPINLRTAKRPMRMESRAGSRRHRYPEVHDGYDRLGMIYEARGDRTAAADCYRKVIEFVKAHPDQYEPTFTVTFEQMIDELDPPPVS